MEKKSKYENFMRTSLTKQELRRIKNSTKDPSDNFIDDIIFGEVID
jgi:hypothetical protein